MRFAFTDDQKMLRDTVREVLQRECASEVVRAAWEGRPDGVRAVWDTLAETGVIGMTASEEAGGMGMGELDLVADHFPFGCENLLIFRCEIRHLWDAPKLPDQRFLRGADTARFFKGKRFVGMSFC